MNVENTCEQKIQGNFWTLIMILLYTTADGNQTEGI